MATVLFSRKKSLNGYIITLCDKDLYGKTIKDKGIEFKINNFYKGDELCTNDIKKGDFENVISIHAIGENSVNLLVNLGIISKDDIKYFGDIPIVLIFYV